MNESKAFERLYNLKVHRRKHNGDKPYSCPMHPCEKKFRWRSSMAHHVKAHHGGSAQDVNRASRKAERDIENCGGRKAIRTANRKNGDQMCKRGVLARSGRPNKVQSLVHHGSLGANLKTDATHELLSLGEDMPTYAWEGSVPGLASGDTIASEDTMFSFLAQSDANTTDAEMISIAQDAANSNTDLLLF